MKKLLFLFAACIAATLANAQTITDKTIAGHWEISGFEISGISWDFASDSFSLPPEMMEEIAEPEKEQFIKLLKESLEPLKVSHIDIKPNKVYEQVMMGEEAKGVYVIAYEDGQHYLDVTNEESDIVDRLKLAMVNGRMQISLPDDEGGEIVMLFDKK